MIIIRLIEFLRSRLRIAILVCVAVLVLLVVGDWLLVNKAAAHTAAEHLVRLLVPVRLSFLPGDHLPVQVVRTPGDHETGRLL